MKFTVTSSLLLSLPLLVSASFPGSPLGLKYNGTSPYGQSKGQLSLVDNSLGKGMVLASEESKANITAHFQPSGTKAVFQMSCPQSDLQAVLVPGELVENTYEVYHLIWASSAAVLPEGSVKDSLLLGPAPDYAYLTTSVCLDSLSSPCTAVSTEIQLGEGIWSSASFEDASIVSPFLFVQN